MTRIRLGTWLEAVADRIHQPYDDRDRALRYTVERLPGGKRRISDPMLPIYLERRRQRIARTGGDPLDRALAGMPSQQTYPARERCAGRFRPAAERAA